MFSNLIRTQGGRVAAAATAAAVTTAAQSPAQARAPPQTARVERPTNVKTITDADGWLFAEVNEENRVVFKPFTSEEIDDAVNEAATLALGLRPAPQPALASGPSSATSPIVTEPDDEASEISDGAHANDVIESTALYTTHTYALEEQQRVQDLMVMTARLLKRPGMQQELVKGMLEDEVIRDVLLREGANLETYLHIQGFQSYPLLPAAAAAAIGPDATGPNADGDAGGDLIQRLLHSVSGALDAAGSALGFLGSWLRDRMADFGLGGAKAKQHYGSTSASGGEPAAAAGAEGAAPAPGSSRGDKFIGSVMMMLVLVFCLLVLKRPGAFRVVRRM